MAKANKAAPVVYFECLADRAELNTPDGRRVVALKGVPFAAVDSDDDGASKEVDFFRNNPDFFEVEAPKVEPKKKNGNGKKTGGKKDSSKKTSK